jgi:hypothetical protein
MLSPVPMTISMALAVALEIGESGGALAGDSVQTGAGFGQGDAAAFAPDQFRAEEFFEFLDLAAIKALSGWISFGSLGDTAGLGDEAETLQAVQ